jgi:hypothetical protein
MAAIHDLANLAPCVDNDRVDIMNELLLVDDGGEQANSTVASMALQDSPVLAVAVAVAATVVVVETAALLANVLPLSESLLESMLDDEVEGTV